MPIGWISPRPDADDRDLFADLPAESVHAFRWQASRFVIQADHAAARQIIAAGGSLDGVVIAGMSLVELESLYVLRAHQLLDRAGPLDLPAIVVVPPDAAPEAMPRFGRRVCTGWPFRSALFIADAPAAALLRREGLSVMERTEAQGCSLDALLARGAGAVPAPPVHQAVAVQIQPSWYYGGSHTVFSNQIDALLDQGWFVVRIFVDTEFGPGPTMRRRMAITFAEANIDATPHLDTVACAPGAPESIDETEADRYLRRQLRNRATAAIADDALIPRLAARADVAVVNYIVHMGFAFRTCPTARIVLETHDDMTRNSVMRSRGAGGPVSFPTLASVRRHMALERMVWRSADACVALSLSELRTIRRHATLCAYVLPRPYARRARDPGDGARWDILIVMNPHHFNVPALDWFLEQVIAADPALADRRIAIVGRIDEKLAPAWTGRLPGVRWLGYLKDIDALRDDARLSVCPDLAGTGVAIKTLTAIAAEHPLVATPVALRGLGGEILALIPPAGTADELRRQIRTLLDDPSALQARRAAVAQARARLWPAASHDAVLRLARAAGADKAPLRARILAALAEDPAPPDDAGAQSDAILIRFGAGGNDRAHLGAGWLHDEPGGRWSDGGIGVIRLPAAWLASPRWLAFSFMPDFRGLEVALRHHGAALRTVARTPEATWFAIDRPTPATAGTVELELVCSTPFCPRDAGLSDDERVLGVRVRALEIIRPDSRALPAPMDAAGGHDAEAPSRARPPGARGRRLAALSALARRILTRVIRSRPAR
jgi:hypothetical protein